MIWALIASFALLAGNPQSSGAKTVPKTAVIRNQQPTPKLIPADMPSPTEDPDAESVLLDLANESRQQSGLPPLRMDESLTQAARNHAWLMVESAHLEHQFAGELSLLQRVAQVSTLRLDRAGENVAYHSSAERAHEALMHSPPHRQNLLDPGFNVAGIAAIWRDGRLYVVQDFAHEVPVYSAQQTAKLVSQAIHEARQRAGMPELVQTARPNLNASVCTMAQENRLSARSLDGGRNSRGAATYTQSRPEILPPGAVHLIETSDAHQFALGTCYARSAQYPTGMFWVAILLY